VSVYQWPGPWLPKPATVIVIAVAAAVGAAVTAAVLHTTPSRPGTPTPCQPAADSTNSEQSVNDDR
jgi:hypothetical protein